MTKTDREEFDRIFKKAEVPLENSFSSEELSCLASAFLRSNEDTNDLRPKGYIILSTICQKTRTAKDNDIKEATQNLVQAFAPFLLQSIGEMDEKSQLLGLGFFTAIFQVDALVASAIFTKDGFLEILFDITDLSPSPLLAQEVIRLLGQACGDRICRGIITSEIVRWLESKILQSSDSDIRVLASLALTKLSRGATSDPPENGTSEVLASPAVLMKALVDDISSGSTGLSADAVEGLAYLTLDQEVKDELAKNSTFLKNLFMLVPTKQSHNTKLDVPSLIYGVSAIIYNLTCFRPRLSEEQQQMEKLRRMTKVSDGEKSTSSLDNDDQVRMRIRLLIAAGVLPVFFAAISASDSNGVRHNVGKALLSVVDEKENRGLVLQAGGGKVLQKIIKSSIHPLSKETMDSMDFAPIQALAKLTITSSPLQVFGPNEGAMYDAIRPFSTLLQHPSSNLLQRFEAIMALTNLASYNGEIASRIANADGLVGKVELLLLEDHVLVRRASVELICNLIVGSDEVFERYTKPIPSSASKVHILLALSDVEDVPTRLAASGALATLTGALTTCQVLADLQFEHHRFLTIMTRLIDPSALPDEIKQDQILEWNPGLIHRGLVCVNNVLKNTADNSVRQTICMEGRNAGLLQSLLRLEKTDSFSKDPAIVRLATETIQLLTI